MAYEREKKAAAEAAAQLITEGMCLGLGTGSTTSAFIHALGKRCSQGLKIQCVASSYTSYSLAETVGIPLIDINSIDRLDVTVDGADEVDLNKAMIKGGGGALLREKILAAMSKEMIVIVDASKCVSFLGKAPLPVEILPFALPATLRHINDAGYQGKIRDHTLGKPFFTENGNMIYDLHLSSLIKDPKSLEQTLLQIPGVIDTGLFLNNAGRIIIGKSDGTTEIRQ